MKNLFLTILLIGLFSVSKAQKFNKDLCNNLKIISNAAASGFQYIVTKYPGDNKGGTYFLKDENFEQNTVYSVNTERMDAVFYKSFTDNDKAQLYLNDVLQPLLTKCYGKDYELKYSDFSRVWKLKSPKPNYDYTLTLCTKGNSQNVYICAIFELKKQM